MTERTATLSFSDGSPSAEFPILPGTMGPEVIDIRVAVREDRPLHLRPRLHVDGGVQVGDHVHRRRQGRAALSRLSDRGARADLRLHGGLPSAAVRRAAERRAAQGLRLARHHAHDGERADAVLHARLPARRASDGGDDRPRRRAVGVLSGLDQPERRAPARHLRDPPDRENADARGDGVQVLGRPAVHVSAQRPAVRDELHADDVRHAVRGLQAERRAGARARPDLHPARGPRAERVDVHRAVVRVVGHEPVRGDRGRRRLPVGPGARRRERGRAEHALRAAGARAAPRRSATSSPRSRTRTATSS